MKIVFYSGRYQNEDDRKLIKRILYSKNSCSYEKCNLRRASIGCLREQCTKIFHLRCALYAGCEIIPFHRGLYCKDCIPFAIQEKKYRLCWPTSPTVRYIVNNKWKNTNHFKKIRTYIKEQSFKWDIYPDENSELMFWKYDLEARTYIREIFPGHWAFCSELASLGHRQYELVAARDIEDGEWIGEYTGMVDYRGNCGKKYTAAYYTPGSVDFNDGDLCVDGERYGNETRYINSLSPTTPLYIKKNATMATVWCAEELRIGVFATKRIKQYCAIIVDYNEYSNTYFKVDEEEDEKYKRTPYVWISTEDQLFELTKSSKESSESTQEIEHSPNRLLEISYESSNTVVYIDLT